VENAVPFRIPRCSFEAKGRGSIPWSSSAWRDETTLRQPKVGGPSKTLIDGLPMRVPAIYERGERSMFISSTQHIV